MPATGPVPIPAARASSALEGLVEELAATHDDHGRLAGRRVVAGEDGPRGRVGVGVEPDVREPVTRGELQQAAGLW
jgi:hypothetical protein